MTIILLAAALADTSVEPIRVRPPSDAGFRPMWCAPSFNLDPTGPECSRTDLDGVDGAFVLRDVLSRAEAARMVATAERMGFERGGDVAGRSNGAVTWCFHDALSEQLIRRIAQFLPWAVAVHSPGTPAPRPDQLPSIEGTPPWVREIGGVPEGLYTLDSLNCRMRLYRYESSTHPATGSSDRFLPHYDEVWPGSRLVFDGDEPVLQAPARPLR